MWPLPALLPLPWQAFWRSQSACGLRALTGFRPWLDCCGLWTWPPGQGHLAASGLRGMVGSLGEQVRKEQGSELHQDMTDIQTGLGDAGFPRGWDDHLHSLSWSAVIAQPAQKHGSPFRHPHSCPTRDWASLLSRGGRHFLFELECPDRRKS